MDLKQKVGQLKQLRYLKGEVIMLSQRIARLENEIDGNVRCRWRGRATLEHGARLTAMRDELANRRAACMAQLDALVRYVTAIDDSLMRQIMAARYIDGLSWKEVAARIGERDEQYPRRLHNRFLTRCALPESLTEAQEPVNDTRTLERGNECGEAKR